MDVVVLVDGDVLQARLIRDNVGAAGYHVCWARYEWEGLLFAHRIRPNLLILDSALPQWRELLCLVRHVRGLETLPVLLITPRRPPRYDIEKLGIFAWVQQPFDANTLVQDVLHILQPNLNATVLPLAQPPSSGELIGDHAPS